MANSSVVLREISYFQDHSSVFLSKPTDCGRDVPQFLSQRTSASAFPLCRSQARTYAKKHRILAWPGRLLTYPKRLSYSREMLLERYVLRLSRSSVSPFACHSSELAVVSPCDIGVHKDGSSQQENLLWRCGEEQESCLRTENYADTLVDGAVSADSPREITSRGLAESCVGMDQSPIKETSHLGENINSDVSTPKSTGNYISVAPKLEIHDSSVEFGGLKRMERTTASSEESQSNEQKLAGLSVGEFTRISFGGSCNSKYEKEVELAVRAVQLSCILSQSIQKRVLRNEENTDFKKDRSIVTVADWGVQAVVSWVLSQVFHGEEIPMIAEEDTAGLRGREKIDLLQRVVAAVNDCLQHAEIVGVSPPRRPLGAIDVLKAINKGSAEGGSKGRYWVLDPVDGTLGFVRGDQYAIALALIEDGEVVLGVLGCPNFPLRKQWLVHHHRYYRIASRLNPPSPTTWHKGLILSATKGAGEVIMRPLVTNADGLSQWNEMRQMVKSVSVSTIDDPATATFCEPFEKANSSHSFTAGLAEHLGLRNRPLRVYSMAKYAAIARGDAEIFMKFAKAGYREKIWDHAAGVLIVQEAGGVVTDAGGNPLDFSQGRFLENLDRGIIACSGKALHDKLLKAVDASWNSSRL